MEVAIKLNVTNMLAADDYQLLLDEARRRNVPVESIITDALARKASEIRDAEQTPPPPPAARMAA